jgi:molybdate transport system regulatory protein
MSVLWVICGAGKGVGKTHLAHSLCDALPHSIYAKQGHGRKRKGKPDHFFDTRRKLEAFIERKREDHEHIVVESNALARSGKGDVIIYIDGIRGKTDFRKDASRLRSASHIRVTHDSAERTWKRVLGRKLADPEMRDEILEILVRQQVHLWGEGYGLRSKVWVVKNERQVIGPGLARVLGRVERAGSLRRAAQDVQISYSKAWKQVKEAEENFGAPLVRTRVGGPKGGRTELTADGKYLLETYNTLDKDIRRYADKLLVAHIMCLLSRHLLDQQPPGKIKISYINLEDEL